MSIPHLEDLKPEELQNVLNNFWVYTVTEKLDGSQLLFGIDEDGFYTSREFHGGMRVYNVDDYEPIFRNTYIRSAHIALESVLPELESAGLKEGMQIEIEVLFGIIPNVINYQSPYNYIVFLRSTNSDFNVENLAKVVNDKISQHKLITPVTHDSKTIEYEEIKYKWKFSSVPVIELGKFYEIDLFKKEIDSFLDSSVYGYKVSHVLSLNLNKDREMIKTVYRFIDVPTLRDELRDRFNDIVLRHKEILLNLIVRPISSKFSNSAGFIEGLVFSSPGLRTFKLVDKDTFLKVKNLHWKHRNELYVLSKYDYTTDELDRKLDKYEKETSTLFEEFMEILRDHGTSTIEASVLCQVNQNRTAEIFASLYQQKKMH